MQNMLVNGLEGRQFTLENGNYVKTADPKLLAEYGMGDSSQLAVLRDKVVTYGKPLVHLRDEMWKKNAEIAAVNPVQPLFPTRTANGALSLAKSSTMPGSASLWAIWTRTGGTRR